jgi:hypothetical protein
MEKRDKKAKEGGKNLKKREKPTIKQSFSSFYS